MAAFTITITNRLNVFGPAQSDKWNAYNWNAFRWGEGTAGLVKAAAKLLSATISLSDSVSKGAFIGFSNSVEPTADMGSERLYDGSGYSRVFPGGVTEGEDRFSPTWAPETSTSPNWSSSVASSTTWSQS